MIYKETTNTFSEGLVMDLNPITTPNNVLTNALNATYITYNGNEYVLQNDMGNGRVETAYLPQGYIPLGTTSFGGIIYIVSYNPLIDKSQIGCFPSPERNIDNYENTVSTETIQDSDFFIMNANTPTEVSNNVRIIQLSNIKLSPGDKYIVHGTNIIANLNILSGYKIGTETLNTKVLNIRLATQDTNGNLIYLDTDLEKYEFKITLPDNSVRTDSYIIKLEESETLFDTDIDAVRSYLASKYNIFNNNVSGNIYIVAKLETIDTFDVTYTVKSTITQDNKLVYYPEFNTEVTSSNGTSIFKWVWTDGTNSYDSSSLNNNKVYYDKASGIKTFVCTPYMKFNNDIVALPYLSKTINIDFQLVGNNTSDLFLWRYYNSDTYLTLNWGLLNHYEPELVDYIEFVFTDLLNTSTFTKTIKDYVSYSGTFIRDFVYDSQLIPNTLYHVTIKLYVKNSSIYSIDKLLYTSKVFNNKYLTDSSVKDFGTLKIQDELDLNLVTDITYGNEVITDLLYPLIITTQNQWEKTTDDVLNTDTLGYTNYIFNNHQKNKSKIEYSYQFNNNYNIFTLNRYLQDVNNPISYVLNIGSGIPTFNIPTNSVLGDLTAENLLLLILTSEINFEYDQSILTKNPDTITNSIKVLNFDLVGTFKNPIWASMINLGVTYSNLIAPLIYNDETLNAYGFTATVNTETPLLCKIDTKKILCIGPNSYSNKDWWIAYAEFIENNKILLKDRNGDLDQTDLKLGSSQYYDSIISDFANKYFNNSPIIPYCFVLTYNGTSYTLYNNDGSNPVEVGTVAGITYADGKNTVVDLNLTITKVLYYGVLIKNSAGYYIPIKLISVGNSDDTYTITDEPNSYVLYDTEVGSTNNITKSSINRKMYELLCQLYKVYTKVNYTQTGTYTYDKKSYYEPFNLEITKDITILLNYINKTIRPFITDLSGINFDINNLNFDIDNVVKNVTLKFTIPILLKLLNYYLLDFSYANFIIRTNTKEFYIPEGITFTTGSLYFINKDAQGDYKGDLVLLNKNSSQTFLNNFRKLLSIKYTNKEHECVFSSIADATNLNKMNILQVLTLNNGVINMETNDSTHELTATGMAFYQSNYGNLIGNLDTN